MLVISLITWVIVASFASPALAADPCWTVPVVAVVRVLDGDTFEAMLAIWPGLTARETVRVLGVDTPELRRGSREERWRAQAAAKFTRDWLAQAGGLTVWACSRDTFGRLLGRVHRGEESLDAALVAAGLGAAR